MDVAPAPTRRPRRKPESPEAKTRRLRALEINLADREHRARTAYAELKGALPRQRGHVTPLGQIDDDETRLAVYRARVERLEALLDQTERKRETRAKIVLGTTLLAEAQMDPDDPLLARLLEIVDRRVHRPRDRHAIAETLGLAIAPMRSTQAPSPPDFEAMVEEALSRPSALPSSGPRRKRGA
jgi:hypothetical protein